MSPNSRGTLPGAEHTLGGFTCLPHRTLFGGYGPFVALVALILAMALLAPTIAPERDVTTRARPAQAPTSLSGTTPDRWRPSATGGVAEERHLGGDGVGTAEGAQR